jgi:STE24 endopeptidase
MSSPQGLGGSPNWQKNSANTANGFTAHMEENLRRARQYSKKKIRLTVVQLFLTIVFLSTMLLSGASSLLSELVTGSGSNFHLQVGLYLAIFAGIYYLLFFPLDFYDSFILEHKFLLSSQTVLDWLKKSIKKVLLSLLILLVAGEALYFFLRHFPNHWWLLATGAWLLLTIVLGKITPVLIIPLFYKCGPLDNDDLRRKLLSLSKSCSIKIRDVFEIQLSKDTKKANAAVVGLGKGRRILLGDTLLNNYSDEEIEAIFAHELGHLCFFHTWKIIGFGTAISLASFYLTYLLLNAGISLFGFDNIYNIAAFPLLSLVLMILGLTLTPIQNGYMRYLEKQADMFAVSHTQNKQDFVSAITKLGNQNLSDPSPNKLVEMFAYTHPPISKRLRYLRQANEEHPESRKAANGFD